MHERRKSPRYPLSLRVFFPDHDLWGRTDNISLDGCFITVSSPIQEGAIIDFLLEIPVVGTIALKGYVQHTQKRPGIGVQLVQVRFSEEQSEYFGLYSRFVKNLSLLEEIRGEYLDLVQRGVVKLQTLPQPS